jgi:hypothetical protein
LDTLAAAHREKQRVEDPHGSLEANQRTKSLPLSQLQMEMCARNILETEISLSRKIATHTHNKHREPMDSFVRHGC